MNTATQTEVLALAKGDQKRLEQLAALAGRSPQSMLKFVLRDGFDAVEEDIRETLAAERDNHREVGPRRTAHRAQLQLSRHG